MNGYALKHNYPNPVPENKTFISFEIPDMAYVSLKVINSRGVEIDELLGKEINSGVHNLVYNLEKLSAGLYFYTINTDNFFATRKMIIPAE